jgi:hypothetical protein
MLDNSAIILQDDSGIPLADFEAKRWRPRKLFQSASPMEFGIGYRWRKNESNLLLAQKESPPGSDEELTPLSQAEGNASGTAAGAVDTVQHHELYC